MIPRLVYSDEKGTLFDHPAYGMVVFDGATIRPPRAEELVPLPPGSDCFLLPGRQAIGLHLGRHKVESVPDALAASAFASPAWLRLSHPAFRKLPGAPDLPLFAYGPLGFARGRFYTTALRVDPSNRQDPRRFDCAEIARRAAAHVERFPHNRLVGHLRHCAVVYGCRAAQNFFLEREECPLPTASTCNATCVGCLSHQPPGGVRASHDRITFTPTPDEIAEVALLHLSRVPDGVVSFGQGCEGEPLMVADTLIAAVRLIREARDDGTINLNTNGSRPDKVAALVAAGLDSIRLSVNSFRPAVYDAYYRPRGFSIEDVIASGRTVRDSGGFVSVNLLVFPGVTDTPADLKATLAGLRAVGADLVQMRNLNIDPDIYLDAIGREDGGRPIGIPAAMARMKAEFPQLRFGYFNPRVRRIVRRRRARG